MAGFADFCENGLVHKIHPTDHRVDVVGDSAVASFACEMVCERSRTRSLPSGRDRSIGRNPGGYGIVRDVHP